MCSPLPPPPPQTLAACLLARLRDLLTAPGGTPLADAAIDLAGACCGYLATVRPMDPLVLAALDQRDDLYAGHACAHCGHDPDSEGDQDAEREACAAEIALTLATTKGRPLTDAERHLARELTGLGCSPLQAVTTARGAFLRWPELDGLPSDRVARVIVRTPGGLAHV